jgi:HTH-type transcriptional regulator / antitoxin HipB
MAIRTPKELGAAIRAQRRRLGLDQSELATKVGVSRKWIIAVEKGSAGAAIGLILRTLRALRLSLDTSAEPERTARRSASEIDLDAIVTAATKPRR